MGLFVRWSSGKLSALTHTPSQCWKQVFEVSFHLSFYLTVITAGSKLVSLCTMFIVCRKDILLSHFHYHRYQLIFIVQDTFSCLTVYPRVPGVMYRHALGPTLVQRAANDANSKARCSRRLNLRLHLRTPSDNNESTASFHRFSASSYELIPFRMPGLIS